MVINKHSFCVCVCVCLCANKNPKKLKRGGGRREGWKKGREREKEGEREGGKKCKRQIFLTLKVIFLYLFLHSGIKGADTACEK